MPAYKCGIVGYRNFDDYLLFNQHIAKLMNDHDFTISHIISGGANGADALAERYAHDNAIPLCVHPADWQKYGKRAGPLRNKLIVDDSDIIIAFLSDDSIGTRNTIKLATQAGKHCHIINL